MWIIPSEIRVNESYFSYFLVLVVYEKENLQYGQLIKVTVFPKFEDRSEENLMKCTETIKSFKKFHGEHHKKIL